jgi:hypothetical protein
MAKGADLFAVGEHCEGNTRANYSVGQHEMASPGLTLETRETREEIFRVCCRDPQDGVSLSPAALSVEIAVRNLRI